MNSVVFGIDFVAQRNIISYFFKLFAHKYFSNLEDNGVRRCTRELNFPLDIPVEKLEMTYFIYLVSNFSDAKNNAGNVI